MSVIQNYYVIGLDGKILYNNNDPVTVSHILAGDTIFNPKNLNDLSQLNNDLSKNIFAFYHFNQIGLTHGSTTDTTTNSSYMFLKSSWIPNIFFLL